MYDIAILIWVMKDSLTFQYDSFVRGYHACMNIWEPLVGKCLKNRKELTNEMGKTAVALIRIIPYSEEVMVGHVQKNLSKGNASVVKVDTDWKFQLIFVFMALKRP